MKYYYCYQITFTDTPHIYFGSRTSKCPPEEDTGYMGSPVTYKQYWIDFTPVKTILFTGFSSRDEAVKYEAELIRNQWKLNKSLSLNDSIPGKNFYYEGRPAWNKGKTGGVGYWRNKERPAETRQKISEKLKDVQRDDLSRKYAGISPEGKVYLFLNAKQFCKKHDNFKLDPSAISACAKGNIKSHKGWRFLYHEDYERLGGILPEIKNYREMAEYIGISPTGEIYSFTNISQFVRENKTWKFDKCSIFECIHRKNDQHKGWVFVFKKYYEEMNGIIPSIHVKRGYIGISPSGDIYKFYSPAKFIRENPEYELLDSGISDCVYGKTFHHKGWRFFYEEEYEKVKDSIPFVIPGLIKKYIAISPTGDKIEFDNAAQFCRDYPDWNFHRSSITQCIKGTQYDHKGWRFFFKEDFESLNGILPSRKEKESPLVVATHPAHGRLHFSNVQKFIKENPKYKWHSSGVSQCLNGKLNHYKGWKFSYADESDIA